MKKFTINTIIINGLKSAPKVGISGAFYKYQFCATREEWNTAFNKAAERGAQHWEWVPEETCSPHWGLFHQGGRQLHLPLRN